MNGKQEFARRQLIDAAVSEFLAKSGCCPVDGVLVKGEALAAALERAIGDMDRGETLDRMASAAGISRSTVNQIMGGSINCPPLSRLQGFARVLGVSTDSLVASARRDGCTYGAD